MRNVIAGAFSEMALLPMLMAGEIVDVPLSTLAVHIRQLTENCSEQYCLRLIDAIAPIEDQRALAHTTDAYPPMSMFVTDRRVADVSGLDFGFAKVRP